MYFLRQQRKNEVFLASSVWIFLGGLLVLLFGELNIPLNTDSQKTAQLVLPSGQQKAILNDNNVKTKVAALGKRRTDNPIVYAPAILTGGFPTILSGRALTTLFFFSSIRGLYTYQAPQRGPPAIISL